MNVLDENIDVFQRRQLEAWNIRFRRIGSEVGWTGMEDHNDIIPLLHSLPRPTFFTRDHDFFHPKLRHHGYCLVYLDVEFDESAEYIRRFLRHAGFRRQAQRMGKVARAHPNGLSYWQVGSDIEQSVGW